MNTLSWFLYFADILVNIASSLVFLGFCFGGAYIGWVIHTTISNESAEDLARIYGREVKEKKAYPKLTLVVLSACCFLTANLLPSKNTMYAIAASELGEEAAKSAIGQKSLKAIEQWIDKQLESK